MPRLQQPRGNVFPRVAKSPGHYMKFLGAHRSLFTKVSRRGSLLSKARLRARWRNLPEHPTSNIHYYYLRSRTSTAPCRGTEALNSPSYLRSEERRVGK